MDVLLIIVLLAAVITLRTVRVYRPSINTLQIITKVVVNLLTFVHGFVRIRSVETMMEFAGIPEEILWIGLGVGFRMKHGALHHDVLTSLKQVLGQLKGTVSRIIATDGMDQNMRALIL